MKLKFALAALLASAAASTTSADDMAALHNRLLTLDTHLDTPINFGRPGWDFSERHTHDNDIAQVDLARMRDGALDGGFFVIYTDQGPLTAQGYADALAFARDRSDLIDATMRRHRRLIRPAMTPGDAVRLDRRGKLFAFKSMENSYPLGGDLSLLGDFYRRGVRMAGPVHGKNNQFADSATDQPQWGGLSPLGRAWVAEMNRLGMVIDASHASDAAFDQLVELSSSPILLSHSSLRSTFDHPRNLDENRLRKLAAKGGAMCISTIFMSPMRMGPARAELFADYENSANLSPAQQADLVRKWRAIDQSEPMWDVDFEAYMKMVLRAIKVAGVDHICFGADWDGGGGLAGIEDISALPKVTERLSQAGYSEADLAKMWSGNVLRIMAAAQAQRKAPR